MESMQSGRQFQNAERAAVSGTSILIQAALRGVTVEPLKAAVHPGMWSSRLPVAADSVVKTAVCWHAACQRGACTAQEAE